MCFYLQQHLLNKEKALPFLLCLSGSAWAAVQSTDLTWGSVTPWVQFGLLLGWGAAPGTAWSWVHRAPSRDGSGNSLTEWAAAGAGDWGLIVKGFKK